MTLRGATFAERLQSCCDAIDGDPLLVLDQFEEFFVYHQTDVAERFRPSCRERSIAASCAPVPRVDA